MARFTAEPTIKDASVAEKSVNPISFAVFIFWVIINGFLVYRGYSISPAGSIIGLIWVLLDVIDDVHRSGF